jgi:hypothetical protein
MVALIFVTERFHVKIFFNNAITYPYNHSNHLHMKKTTILYWIITGLFAAFMIFSAIPDIMSTPEAVQIVNGHMGYPTYFIPYIGVAKLIGAIIILIPGFPRLKEWAYAGLLFDLLSACYSFVALHDPFSQWYIMLLPIIFLFVSYILYHKKLKAVSVR